MSDERKHIEGRPVSTSTYINWSCRCDGCRECQRLSVAEYRARKRGRDRARAYYKRGA